AHEGEDHAHEGEDHAHEGEDHAHEGEDHAHEGGSLDPHIWFDMSRMARLAALMVQQFQQAAGGTPEFGRCGEQVAAQITEAETEVRATLESVPANRRILVTDHEALGYLAEAYGFEIAGAVIPSSSTLAEPSSADLATLAEVIRAEGVPAIFANVSQPTQLAEAVAGEAGTQVQIVPLYVESLGEPGSPAADYIGLMRENARLIASALAP
ncbi:MAG: metal ABC transporter solute-binding protein, Zn/Mn family, partial [Actinomycetales bacterium]